MTEQLRIGTAVPRIQYLADGTQTLFTYPFPIQSADDLQVWLGGTLQASGVSVGGAGLSAGGTVTFATPPASGVIVTLRRWLAIRRTTDFQDDGIIRARTLNDELDTQTMVAQQLAEEIGRAPRRSPFSVSSADLTLPEPAAGRALKWNESGTGLDNSVSDPDDLGGAAVQAQASAAQATAAAAQAEDGASRVQAAVAGLLTFSRIAVAGQAELVADQLGDTLTLAAGANVTITTNGLTDAITIAATGGVSAADYAAQQQQILQLYLSTALSGSLAAGGFVSGGYDAYGTDTIVAGSSGQMYDNTAKLYWNPGGYAQVTPTGSVFGNMTSSGGLASAFNGILFQAGVNSAYLYPATPGYIGKAFATAQTITQVKAYSTSNGASGFGSTAAGQSILIYGKNGTPSSATDGTLIGTSGTFTGSVSQVVTIACSGSAYTNVWAVIGNGNDALISQLVYYTTTTPANMTLVSSALSPAPSVAPSTITLDLLWLPVDAATLNTDLTVEVTRDGGTTWTAGTLIDTGLLVGGFRLIRTVIDVSAQPSGTAVKYRIKTFNAKTQKVKGVTLAYK